MNSLINGLADGLILAVLATGFQLPYIGARVFHLALGASFALAPFVANACLQHQWGIWPAIFMALLASAVLSALCEAVNHWRLECKNSKWGTHLISSIGIYMVVVSVIAVVWGNKLQSLWQGGSFSFEFMGLAISRIKVIQILTPTIVLSAFYGWIHFTKMGVNIKGLADNPVQLGVIGHNIRMLRLVVFSLAGVMAAIASLLFSLNHGFDSTSGMDMVILAFIALVIGGKGSFAGGVIGGIFLGIVRYDVMLLWSARWQEAITFAILVAFLFFRPSGLLAGLGKKTDDLWTTST